ncbi:hypothetical protein CCMA1212_007721 [Trichoderma ghanense]|uniref:Uncharacterized protein n=1 Tax=Trichoderma ghanense TaxID=65468 RepID=A0ABY2GWM7_9HYPO
MPNIKLDPSPPLSYPALEVPGPLEPDVLRQEISSANRSDLIAPRQSDQPPPSAKVRGQALEPSLKQRWGRPEFQPARTNPAKARPALRSRSLWW